MLRICCVYEPSRIIPTLNAVFDLGFTLVKPSITSLKNRSLVWTHLLLLRFIHFLSLLPCTLHIPRSRRSLTP